jgi:hypothetical protein
MKDLGGAVQSTMQKAASEAQSTMQKATAEVQKAAAEAQATIQKGTSDATRRGKWSSRRIDGRGGPVPSRPPFGAARGIDPRPAAPSPPGSARAGAERRQEVDRCLQ